MSSTPSLPFPDYNDDSYLDTITENLIPDHVESDSQLTERTTMKQPTFSQLQIPTYTASDIKEYPWIELVELQIWGGIATAIESSSSSPDLSRVAEELNALFPTNRSSDFGCEKEEPESFLWEFWGILAKAAGQIPTEHPAQERLIDLIKALLDLPEVDCEGWWGNTKLWSDLPVLGPAFREALDVDTGVNLEGFIARLCGSGLAAFWWLALRSLNEALEQDPHAKKRGEDEWVPRAALWIRFAGAGLYKACLACALKDSEYRFTGNWKGDPGLSRGRWEFWKRRFGEISVCVDERVSIMQETRDMARMARIGMDEVDGSALGKLSVPDELEEGNVVVSMDGRVVEVPVGGTCSSCVS